MPEPGAGSWLDFDGHWGNHATGFSFLKSKDGPRGPRHRVAAADESDYCRASLPSKPSLWNDPITWFQALDADEQAEGNQLGKVNASVPLPLTIMLGDPRSAGLDHATAAITDAEYIDNPITARRTAILHEPEPTAIYRATIATESGAAIPDTLAEVIMHIPDLRAGQDVVVRYQLPADWGQASTATVLLDSQSDLALEVDLDGDGVAEQQILPAVREIIRTSVYLPLLSRP
jgi:hypothetical protein